MIYIFYEDTELDLVSYGASMESMPTSSPTYPYLGECEGDCDIDSDCDGTLVCYQRDDTTQVPGCSTGGDGDVSGYDYCYDHYHYYDGHYPETTLKLPKLPPNYP